MKVVLAGAFGNLGAEILKVLCREGHEVIAADLKEKPVEGTEGKHIPLLPSTRQTQRRWKAFAKARTLSLPPWG